MKEKWVISLGGSRISPNEKEIDYNFIKEFKKLILKHKNKKFVVVTGGGSTARRYISALKKLGKKEKQQSLEGISVTRFHAGFLARIFGNPANEIVPRNMKKVESLLRKNQIIFCGALRYNSEQTSDGTAASLAAHLNCKFINLTNVKGLYTSDPNKNKNAKLIKKITWEEFNQLTKKIKFKPGQHFVLDKSASEIILKNEIPTYIIGSLKDLEKIIKNKSFNGTMISR